MQIKSWGLFFQALVVLAGVLLLGVEAWAVPKYDVFETSFTSSKTYTNPFTDVEVTVEFTAPTGGRKLTAYAFHDGASTWKVRFAPDETGTWTYKTMANDTTNTGLHNKTGSFTCDVSSNKGFIGVDPTRKYYFSFSDGSPFYGIGDTSYGLVNEIRDCPKLS